MKKLTPGILLVLSLVLAGCNGSGPLAFFSSPTPTSTNTPTAAVAPTSTSTPSPTPTATSTNTPISTNTPTATSTQTRTTSPTPTLTPTYANPIGTVRQQANCRYGPGTAYLYRWGLYKGDQVTVYGRDTSGMWVYVKPYNLNTYCWVAGDLLDITGDIRNALVEETNLPHTTFYGPPQNVQASRNGDTVTVTWADMGMTEDKDRGALLEVHVCQNGELVSLSVQTYDEAYSFTDESGCSESSGGLIYTAEKHGYSDPVTIPWP